MALSKSGLKGRLVTAITAILSVEDSTLLSDICQAIADSVVDEITTNATVTTTGTATGVQTGGGSAPTTGTGTVA